MRGIRKLVRMARRDGTSIDVISLACSYRRRLSLQMLDDKLAIICIKLAYKMLFDEDPIDILASGWLTKVSYRRDEAVVLDALNFQLHKITRYEKLMERIHREELILDKRTLEPLLLQSEALEERDDLAVDAVLYQASLFPETVGRKRVHVEIIDISSDTEVDLSA